MMDFSAEESPMLIGITRRSLEGNNSLPTLEYEFKVLFKGHHLMNTQKELNLETLLNELDDFRTEFYENETQLMNPFNFAKETLLCPEIILEIANYLSLNDAVTVFSIDILELLSKYKVLLPLVQPSRLFMKKTIQTIDNTQIISLCLDAIHFTSTMQLASSLIFNNIMSLTLMNFQRLDDTNVFKTYFPKLKRLSLHYNDGVDFHHLCEIFNQIQVPIKQFEIYCDYIRCFHYRTPLIFPKTNKYNPTVESFLIHLRSLIMPMNWCSQKHDTCFLKTTTNFIRSMGSIRSVRFIINRGNVSKLFDVHQWKTLEMCDNLKNVTIKVIKNTSQDTQLTQKILKTQSELLKFRQPIQLHVKFK
ncbi:unnamed protein product [Adineta steineri]|uniref:F-box domain-containing protein n=1 Tax=Adineta steineri TaxID=433720 RepID=A0A819G4P1_9BILA|nr:unnamed protein product [Adineta steineri]CAF1401689.1 unnamed protein product [Adineta steineri]CAF3647960.1 unnamed protein product [Adineta steineri]CAF3878527.1 unnamed protein product [Adineta steineri]